MTLRNHIDFLRLVAVLMVGTFLSACMTSHTQSLEPERFRTPDSTPHVRLTLTSGDRLIVHGPVITGDSFVGMGTLPASPYSLERVSVPLATIEKAEVRGARTGTIVAVQLVAAVMVVALVTVPRCYGLGCKH
jgi:hypothetical protein